VLGGDALLATAKTGALAAGVEAGENVLHQGSGILGCCGCNLSTTCRLPEWPLPIVRFVVSWA
jgi:hypothetical protein